MLISVPGSVGRGHRRSSAAIWGWEGSGWKQAGPAPSLCPLCAAGTSSSRASAVLCSSRTFLLAAFSVVEYPLQLLHSPAAPVVKRPGALSAHHPLQVLLHPLAGGSRPHLWWLAAHLGDHGVLCSCSPASSVFLSCLLVSSGYACLLCPSVTLCPPSPSVEVSFGVSNPLGLPQEPSQPLNLTAKPKAPELPNASSSPSLKMSNCGPRPPSHGAPTRDLQASPPSLPLGKPPTPFPSALF